MAMKLFGLCGTDREACIMVTEGLLAALRTRGLSVSVLVEADNGFDLDRPGKDSFEHRHAGAHEVIIASARRWALLHENTKPNAPDCEAVARTMAPADLVLLVGFQSGSYPKLVLTERAERKDLLGLSGRIVPARTDGTGRLPLAGQAVYDLADFEALADNVMAVHGLSATERPVTID